MKVLIVDDEEDIRAVARIGLSRAGGMEVVEAAGGEDAVAIARLERPDVVLLDVMMPGMDGPSTLAALRARPETAWIPVVFLTAKVLASEVDRLRGLGAAAVLQKPFDPLELADLLRKALGR